MAEKIRKALDIKDAIAGEDKVANQVHAMANVDDVFLAAHPEHDQLDKVLATKEKMAQHGMSVAEEEQLWQEELEEGIAAVAK